MRVGRWGGMLMISPDPSGVLMSRVGVSGVRLEDGEIGGEGEGGEGQREKTAHLGLNQV